MNERFFSTRRERASDIELAVGAPPIGLLRADGADALAFLQGQLSNDLRRLDAGRAQLAGLSSPKGRLLAVLHLWRDNGAFMLELPDELAESVRRRLLMYVLRAKVTLTLLDTDIATLAIAGYAAPEALRRLGLPVPEPALALARAGAVAVRRCHGELPRFLLCGPRAKLEAMRSASVARPLTERDWRLLEILAGVPVIRPATQDRFVAQMVNLDLLGGISFDKGCYTGQEVIARLHYLGNLKRRMFLLYAEGPEPAPGTPIVDALGDGQSVGEVVDAAAVDSGHCAIAAVLQLGHARSDTLRLATADGTALSVPAPFASGLPPLPQ